MRDPVARLLGADSNSFIKCGRATLVSPERVVVRDLDHDDTDTVRVRDPQFHESPRLSPRFAEDRYTGVQQTPMLCVHVSHLHPQSDHSARRLYRPTADLEKTVAQKEDHAGYVRAAELPVDGKP